MQPFAPEAIRLSRCRGLTIRILAQGLTFAALSSQAWASAEMLVPEGGSFFVAAGVAETWTGFGDWLHASYARAPALVLGLAALMVAAPLMFLGLRVSRRDSRAVTVSEARTQVRRAPRSADVEPRDGVRTGHIPLRPLQAWIEVVETGETAADSGTQRYSLARTLLRIGRETDNDICLQDITVHRYHAAIHRTEDAEFVITDLSSARGNGVVVNGRAVAEARLASGDMIELGNARLKFSAAPPS